MAEYIDKNAALQQWGNFDEIGDAYRYIRNFPAADVAPVRHGRWVKKHDEVCYWTEAARKLAHAIICPPGTEKCGRNVTDRPECVECWKKWLEEETE